jgi:NADH-quinone oxidoreductase subunit C
VAEQQQEGGAGAATLADERAVLRALQARLSGGAILGSRESSGKVWIDVDRGAILDALRFLRDDPALGFRRFVDVTCCDFLKFPGHAGPRFGLVYVVYSQQRDAYVRLKVWLEEGDERSPSAASVFPGASWGEREVFDLFGIRFDGHPDLRRILMPDDYAGHPLRKDYPLRGRGERDSFPVLTREES